MAQSIEAFVKQLQAEGVDAGKAAAEQHLAEARRQADQIIADAKAQAEQIVQQARADSATLAVRQQSELELSARDAILRLRRTIADAIAALLHQQVTETLDDRAFLAQLIHDVVVQYATDDAHGGQHIEINVSPEAVDKITDWAMKFLGEQRLETARTHVDLRGRLKGVGFEYRVSESTVEVTAESITEMLRSQVSPRVREVLDNALGLAKQA